MCFQGGWASGSCPHLVIYCLKFVLRGESPRDYADLLRSLKYPPSVTISDIPHRLAIHTNNTVPGFFSPNEGRLFSPNDTNIKLAEEGKLQRRLPWLANNFVVGNVKSVTDNVHPATGQKDRYSLSDRFHERNSSNRADILRRATLSPELNGVVNTEAEEQIHRSLNCLNYSLNNMKPVNHMFIMRLKIHLSNEDRNSAFKMMLERTFSAHAGATIQVELNAQGKFQKVQGQIRAGFKNMTGHEQSFSNETPSNVYRECGREQTPETVSPETEGQQLQPSVTSNATCYGAQNVSKGVIKFFVFESGSVMKYSSGNSAS